MKPIRLVPFGHVELDMLEAVRGALRRQFGVTCSVGPGPIDPAFALHGERRQYHSTALLETLLPSAGSSRLLGITAVDLYIPILTFVFGEAQLGGDCAIVSYHRLQQEFYGLPADRGLTRERLIKEAVHEVGHNYGLTHCDDYECVMAAAHSVEWVDVKGAALCAACHAETRSRRAVAR